jgi:hypothetical protein
MAAIVRLRVLTSTESTAASVSLGAPHHAKFARPETG